LNSVGHLVSDATDKERQQFDVVAYESSASATLAAAVKAGGELAVGLAGAVKK